MEQNRPFKRVVLMSRPGKQTVPPTLIALHNYLQAIDIEVKVEESTAATMPGIETISIPHYALAEHADLIIVVGGDGSMINAAHVAIDQQLPVLGINRGRLGFLTDIYPHELESICQVLAGDYISEERFLIEAHIDNQIQSSALNEVVLLPGDIAHMIAFDILINDQFVCSQRADGLIIATPTGSTAYALSGGGPILHPKLGAIVLLPMFPHMLSNRPLVIGSQSDITIRMSKDIEQLPFISCDGQERIALPPEKELHITQHAKALQLIHPRNYNYYATLRSKLGWQTRSTKSHEETMT